MCTKCAKDSPALMPAAIAICANGRREQQQLCRTIGEQPTMHGTRHNLFHCPASVREILPLVCEGNGANQPRNRSWCQSILTICVLTALPTIQYQPNANQPHVFTLAMPITSLLSISLHPLISDTFVFTFIIAVKQIQRFRKT